MDIQAVMVSFLTTSCQVVPLLCRPYNLFFNPICVSVHSDGWIRGCHQELILWVLPEWRNFVQWGRCVLIIGQSRVVFDPLHFVHGLEWINVSQTLSRIGFTQFSFFFFFLC
jgi:hypothetical protein